MTPSECPLLARAKRGECMACGAVLTGRQKRWCGRDECVNFYGKNHWWTAARYEAIQRATVHEPLIDALRREGWRHGRAIWTICDQCGALAMSPEVNHVEPRVGAGYGTGCWNHQTNLQVLCHDCHVSETNRQKRERIAGIWPGMPLSLNPRFASWAEAEQFIQDPDGYWRSKKADAEPLPLWSAA